MGLLPDPLHPAVVHFPIVLAVVAVLFELVARRPQWRGLAPAGAALMVLAACGAAAAVVTGGWAEDGAVVPTAAVESVNAHEEMGETTLWVLAGVAAVRLLLSWLRRFDGWRAWAYIAAAVAAALLVARTGHLGGELVFRHGIGTAPVQRQVGREAPLPSVVPDRP